MTDPEILEVTIRGGEHDGDVYRLPAEEAGAGDTFGYLDGHYRLTRAGTDGWIGRHVGGDV